MRLTCLKCGHQFEVATGPSGPTIGCICGTEFEPPGVVDTGVLPSSDAAERSRQKAFRAAGLVRNVGGFAFGIAVLGLLFFPLALVGAGVGIYCLTMLRGPVGRYSGRRWAIWAIVVGVVVFIGEGGLALDWLQTRRAHELLRLQATAADDLKRLRRSEVLYRATHPSYGNFADFRFKPATGRYTIYLGASVYHPGKIDGEEVVTPLPAGFAPAVGPDDFTAVAVANLDGDDDLDVWVMTSEGSPNHASNDLEGLELSLPLPGDANEVSAGGAGGTGLEATGGAAAVGVGEETSATGPARATGTSAGSSAPGPAPTRAPTSASAPTPAPIPEPVKIPAPAAP